MHSRESSDSSHGRVEKRSRIEEQASKETNRKAQLDDRSAEETTHILPSDSSRLVTKNSERAADGTPNYDEVPQIKLPRPASAVT